MRFLRLLILLEVVGLAALEALLGAGTDSLAAAYAIEPSGFDNWLFSAEV